MIAAVDIETSCGVESCPGFGNSNASQCEHAVQFKKNKIDIIGAYDGKDYHIFKSVSAFDGWINSNKVQIVGHGFKFDYKTLKAKGSKITPRQIVGDTQLLGSVVNVKVPAKWLTKYNEKRAKLNENLPPRQRHRVGSPLSLKTMAPFYIGVDPFWENPIDHNDENYNRLDCIYTYNLHSFLERRAVEDGTIDFYQQKLLPWAKLIAEAEYEGILIDEVCLHRMYQESLKEVKKLEDEVHKLAAPCFEVYISREIETLKRESAEKAEHYISTRLKDLSKADGVRDRYAQSLADKIARLPTCFNLQSPQQVKNIFGFFGIDMSVERRDKETNEWIETEGTDKYVLKRAKVKGSEFATKFLLYREKVTETSYLKQYIEAVVDGRIYCNFNVTGTRTGRLSSSGPNLQNVKGALRTPFIVADPKRYSIYTVDASQIEPRLVAFYAQDEDMVKLFVDGRDYHNYATKKFFPTETYGVEEHEVKKSFVHLRKTAKIGDLSIIYGTGARTFQTMCLVREEMDIPFEHCQKMVDSFRDGMRGVFGYKRGLEENYKRGTLVYSYMGRLVQARDDKSVHMTLFNTKVQGTASDMILHGSLMAFRHFSKYKIDAKPLMWIHDEVVWRFPKGKEKFCKDTVDYFMKAYKLETPFGVVPLDVEGKLAHSWEK